MGKVWLIVCLTFMYATEVYAYHAPFLRDSTKARKPTTKNDTWYHAYEPETGYVIDSTIYNLEEYNRVQRQGIEYVHAGNTGSAAMPQVYNSPLHAGFRNGYHQFDVYKYHIDSVRYYRVIRPYTELNMIIGLRRELLFSGRFANSHRNGISYGVDFSRINSDGGYVNQKTNINGFNLYGMYNSPSNRWGIQTDLIFNNVRNQENGGVTVNPFSGDFFQKSLVPVSLQKAEVKQQQIDYYLKTTFRIGPTYEVYKDTTPQKRVMSLLEFSHRFNIERVQNSYRDLTPDAAYYGKFYLKDSVFNNTNYHKVGNALSVAYNMRKKTDDTSYIERNLKAEASVQHDYYFLNQNLIRSQFQNLYVNAAVRSNAASGSKIRYMAAATYYLYGWNQNDIRLQTHAGYDFGKIGMLTAEAGYSQSEQPYLFEQYTSHPAEWNFRLPKQQTFKAGGKYQNETYGFYADVFYCYVKNLPVYPGYANPFLNSGRAQNAIITHVANRHQWKGLHLDNDLWITNDLGNSRLTDLYAFIFWKGSLYYEARIFKKVLWLSTGFDVRMRYPQSSPYYDPLLATFYPTNVDQPLVPLFDWFLNAKIKTVRISLKVDNLLSVVGLKGYNSLYQYPAQDISFRAGVSWRFFE